MTSNEARENRQRAEYFHYQRKINEQLNGGQTSLWQRMRQFTESFLTGAVTAHTIRELFKR